MRLIQEENRRQEEAEFHAWYADLLALPPDYELKLKNGWKADIELQPLRWLDRGISLIQSAKVSGHIQLAHDVQGPPTGSFLPYPVFQSGTEIFLKGMWLCQYEDCRLSTYSFYIEPAKRKEYLSQLKNTLGHNLIKIIGMIKAISKYQEDAASREFLKVVEAIVRRDYFPLFEADAKGGEWASSRYPKRFYNDATLQAGADSLSHYPEQQFVAKVFNDAKQHIDELWGLHALLSAKAIAKSGLIAG
jgi:hypothetical protein